MNLEEHFRISFEGLQANKMRSLLTMLGIIIGVAAVITLVSVGRGVEDFVAIEFQGLGSDLLFITGQLQGGISLDLQAARRAGGFVLTNDDVEALRDPFSVPDVITVVPEYGGSAVVTRGRNETRTSITGTTPEYPDVRNFQPIIGRFFTEHDLANGTRVAVLGQTVYEALFPDNEVPIDQTIKISNMRFSVIGMMEEKGGTALNDRDDVILIPISTAQRRLFPARRPDGKYRVDLIYAQVANEERQEAAIAEIELVLRDQHSITYRDEDDFTVLSQKEIASAFSQVTGILTTFLGIIAGISLLVGGIGIMNIMLVSVTERTREIGLRKAVGAKHRDILWQFLIEAVLLATVGGLLGLLLGIVSAGITSTLTQSLRATVDWTAVVGAITISAAVGLVFGVYPAVRAARLNPIDALRYE
jgi:putative ABC transport system permease protein